MWIKTRIALATAGVALSAGLIATPAAFADASATHGSDGGYSAQAGKLHLYENASYKGGWFARSATDKNLHNNKFDNGHTVGNEVTSVKNQSNKYVDLWDKSASQNDPCTGAHTTSYPGTQDPSLSNDAIKNDRLSCVVFR